MTSLPQPDLPEFAVRFAEEADCPVILRFIQALAEYEKMSGQVAATVEKLRESLFVKRQAEVIIAEYQGRPVGFALFFENYSTFLGQANMYLEDLFVNADCRGKGFGKALFQCLAALAVRRGYRRIDWWCLDWNRKSIDFYLGLGAKAKDEWTVYRLQGEALERLGDFYSVCAKC